MGFAASAMPNAFSPMRLDSCVQADYRLVNPEPKLGKGREAPAVPPCAGAAGEGPLGRTLAGGAVEVCTPGVGATLGRGAAGGTGAGSAPRWNATWE